MRKKNLWKIEELWQGYYKPEQVKLIDVSSNYKNTISKYHKRFHQVKSFDFTESQNLVFKDDYGEYSGLKKYQVLEQEGKLIYLFDNHNEMLYPIIEIAQMSGEKYEIVHIDAHPDDAEFQGEKTVEIDLKNIQEYIAKTRISDFFDAISGVSLRGRDQSLNEKSEYKNGSTLVVKQSKKLIGEIHRVCHSDSFEFFVPPENPYILSLDIDIFGPEGDFAEMKDKVRAIAAAWSRADAVCIAMSPGFIDQEYAKNIIQIFTV